MSEITIRLDYTGELLCEEHWGQDYFAGSAMTDWHCDYCNGEHTHNNTATPNICLGCSIQRGECQRCTNKLGQFMTVVK